MATTKQTTANRQNSKHSTGPSTEAGKAASSQNSLKHGLASSQLIVTDESEEDFNILLTGLIAEHQPTTLTETLLVQDMAKYHWLVDRALRLQTQAIEHAYFDLNKLDPLLALLMRYQTTHQHAFQKAFDTLNAMRKAAQPKIGSASQPTAAPPLEPPPPMEHILEMSNKGYFYNPGTREFEYHKQAASR